MRVGREFSLYVASVAVQHSGCCFIDLADGHSGWEGVRVDDNIWCDTVCIEGHVCLWQYSAYGTFLSCSGAEFVSDLWTSLECCFHDINALGVYCDLHDCFFKDGGVLCDFGSLRYDVPFEVCRLFLQSIGSIGDGVEQSSVDGCLVEHERVFNVPAHGQHRDDHVGANVADWADKRVLRIHELVRGTGFRWHGLFCHGGVVTDSG